VAEVPAVDSAEEAGAASNRVPPSSYPIGTLFQSRPELPLTYGHLFGYREPVRYCVWNARVFSRFSAVISVQRTTTH
jgi:hypothetical protein